MLCLVVVVLSSKGIGDEATVSLQGDMPRYLMNGVYFHDLIRDLPLTNIIDYTYKYFAQYPALSLGHHPVLLGIAEVPFYAILGISVSSARWTIIFFMLLAVIAWFLLLESIFDDGVAFLSSLLFVTSPIIVDFSRVVMSEIPALALIILSVYYFHRFFESGKRKHAIAFVVSFVLSAYAKQVAIFMLPAFVLHIVIRGGVRKLVTKEVVLCFVAIGVLLAPLALMTLKFSPANVRFATSAPLAAKADLAQLFFYPRTFWSNQVSAPVVVLSVLSIGVGFLRRDRRLVLFLLWITALYGLLIYIGLRIPRLAIYWVPPFCLFASLSKDALPYRVWRIALTGIVVLVIGYQVGTGYASEPSYAKGYEDAAAYVVENWKGATVMSSANVDSGYFTFFVRKRDPAGRIVVLRADKVLATSFLHSIVEDRVSNREEIYQVLKEFGTCYVVLEEGHYKSRALDWLQQEVKKDRFVLRREIPIQSKSERLQGVALGIYEYKECGPPNPDAILQMNIPLIGDSIEVRLAEIVE